MGVRAMDTFSACWGKRVLAILLHAGQQDVPIQGIFSGTSSRYAWASCTVHRSAPIATSMTSEKPHSRMAARILPGVPALPNCPTKAGATQATTSSPRRIALMVWKIWLLSAIAPKGQFTRHMPQLTHLSLSILARPSSSDWIASMPQAAAQGRSIREMAW